MKCPLILNQGEEQIMLGYFEDALKASDDFVKERNDNWDNHKIKTNLSMQQKQVKHIRKAMGCTRKKGIPSVYLYAEAYNVNVRYNKWFVQLEKCKQDKAAGKKKIKWPKRPEPRSEKMKRIPRWKRSLNMRHEDPLNSVHKSMKRCDDNPLYVRFKLPGLKKSVKYRNHRDIPQDAQITQMTPSYENGRWWISFNWRLPKEQKPNLIITPTHLVPSFTGLTSQGIVGLLDMTKEQFKAGDIGCNSIICLSDSSCPDRFNLTKKQIKAREKHRRKAKYSQTRLNRKKQTNGEEAYQGENWKKETIKLQNAHRKMTGINENQRYQMIAELAKECHILVLEDLNNKGMQESGRISRDTKRRMAETGFGEIKRISSYKFGDRLILVNPAYTSRTCSCCGHQEKANRNGGKFRCRVCGYTANADKNASINILAAGVVAEPEKFRFKVMPEDPPDEGGAIDGIKCAINNGSV